MCDGERTVETEKEAAWSVRSVFFFPCPRPCQLLCAVLVLADTYFAYRRDQGRGHNSEMRVPQDAGAG